MSARIGTVVEDGVRRYKRNWAVSLMADAAMHGRKFDLNDLWRIYAHTKNPERLQQLKDFYKMLGYSVCGFHDVFDQHDSSDSSK